MKLLYLLLAVIMIELFTGCATTNHRDNEMLIEHHVSPQLYSRMMHGQYLPLCDIIELSQRQVPPDFIVHYIWSTHGVYHLSKADVAFLQKNGVSKQVTDFLVATVSIYAPHPHPYWPYDPYYYPYYPYGYYGGGPTVIIGGGYYGHHWH